MGLGCTIAIPIVTMLICTFADIHKNHFKITAPPVEQIRFSGYQEVSACNLEANDLPVLQVLFILLFGENNKPKILLKNPQTIRA